MTRFVLLLLLIVLAVVVAPFLWRDERPTPPLQNLPWQVQVHPQGTSSVFGFELGSSTLADARARFGEELEIAIIAAPGEPGNLEAYLSRFTAGVLTGKLILSADLPAAAIGDLRRSAAGASPTATGGLKIRLSADDLDAALRAPIASITFIPSVNIDPETALRRFGAPARRVADEHGAEHWLYPDQGMDLILHPEQKEVLQYVAPKHFEWLEQPLDAATKPDRP